MRNFGVWNVLGVGVLFFFFSGSTKAADISGSISTTLTIFENSQLVGDVTCTVVDAPCISFGSPNITLRLNGFTITGRAEPPVDCVPPAPAPFAPEDGISALQMNQISILGPGMVQKFRRHGIILGGNQLTSGTRNTLSGVTSNQNCYSGIFMNGVTDSDIIENVSVRNSAASGPRPCGGNCITNSHNNRILRNVFSGNGSVADGNNDFGAGLIGNSRGNLLEENAIGGNTNGIYIDTGAYRNVIRRNIVIGNPAMQVSLTNGATVGFDIRVLTPNATNLLIDNLCATYSGPLGGAPCGRVPDFAGHRNASTVATAAGVTKEQ